MGSAIYHITSTFLSLDFKHVFYIGVAAGALGTGIIIGSVGYLSRLFSISTQVVHRLALRRLAKSAAVRDALGPNIRSGSLRAYTVHHGHLSRLGSRVTYVEPRAQMLFQVTGDHGEGMATIEAVKHKGVVTVTLAAIDTLATPGKPSELILAYGSEDKLHVRGTLRGFLQSERAQYIPQDRTLSEDELLREQEGLPVEEPGSDAEEGEGEREGAAAARPGPGATPGQ